MATWTCSLISTRSPASSESSAVKIVRMGLPEARRVSAPSLAPHGVPAQVRAAAGGEHWVNGRARGYCVRMSHDVLLALTLGVLVGVLVGGAAVAVVVRTRRRRDAVSLTLVPHR